MNPGIKKLLDELVEARKQLAKQPGFTFGVVTSVSPLTVHLDAEYDSDDNPVLTPATSFAGTLTVGANVFCVKQDRRVFVIAAA